MNTNTKKLFFLSGLARSGSTLLGSILNQHPQIHVTPTSPVLDLICKVDTTLNSLQDQYTFPALEMSVNVVRSIMDSAYQHIEKPIVFDKHRGWPRNLGVAQSMFPSQQFKGIVTYRPVPEIITSFIKLFDKDPNNFIDAALRRDHRPCNTRNRADELWRDYMQDPHLSTIHGLSKYRENLLPLSYDEIVLDTSATLGKIQAFFDIPGVGNLRLGEITNTCAEAKDDAWGVRDLHTIRPVIAKTSNDACVVLGKELFEFYSSFNLKITHPPI